MVGFGQFWIGLFGFGEVWPVLVSFRQVWLVLVSFEQGAVSLRRGEFFRFFDPRGRPEGPRAFRAPKIVIFK